MPYVRHRDFLPASLSLALLGWWLPWITHRAAVLRLNGYELSEWVAFLPGVRDGSLPFGRLSPLLPLASLALLFGVVAARTRSVSPLRRRWRAAAFLPAAPPGWASLALALLCCAVMFPPYEAFVRPDWWPDYQPQFFAACAALAGLLLVLALPDEVNDALQVIAALLGGGYTAWLGWAVWSAVNPALHAGWSFGLGLALMLWGFAGAALSGWARVFGPRLDPRPG
jgi:hypothetical protein